MSMEEQDLLRSAVREFAQKSIENNVLKIEHEGVDATLLKSLATQGFLGAKIPDRYGGSGIDQAGYLAILEELASFSPSVAALVMITNSIAAPLIGDKDPDTTRKLASGEAAVSVALGAVLEGAVQVDKFEHDGNRIKAGIQHAINAQGKHLISISSNDNALYLFRKGVSSSGDSQGLSFRGLKSGPVKLDSEDFLKLDDNGQKALEAALDSCSLEVAAIALGISRGALQKAVEYVKVRKTFDRPLKDYGPVAATLSRLMSELQVLSFSLHNSDLSEDKEKLMLKTLAVDFAKRATKYSLQFHGGYGYIEDFGVEKYYRDAAGLSILFQRPGVDSQRLSEEIFGEKSGYL